MFTCWFVWCSGVTIGSEEPNVWPFSFLEEEPDEHIGAAEPPLPLFAEFPEILADVEFLLKWLSSDNELMVPVVFETEMVPGLVLPFLGLSSLFTCFSL